MVALHEQRLLMAFQRQQAVGVDGVSGDSMLPVVNIAPLSLLLAGIGYVIFRLTASSLCWNVGVGFEELFGIE